MVMNPNPGPFQSGVKIIPVSHLVMKIKDFLENRVNMTGVLVSGELSNVKEGGNGHLYFNLKDDRGGMSCAMWSSYRRRLDFVPEEGMSVTVSGALNVYEKRGSMTLVCTSMQRTGLGDLYIRFEELKKRLQAEGLFNPALKKPKPKDIEKIAIVTGENTAALQDIMKTIKTRWPMLQTTLYPTLVQGDRAAANIVSQLKKADEGGYDAILLVRGGGSFEDLFCFSDEQIVRTLRNMKTYTVTGIGHEIDTSLADLAADHRAVTPTAAAQWVTPDQKEVLARIEQDRQSMIASTQRLYRNSLNRLMMIQSNPWLMDPLKWAASRKDRLALLNSRLAASLRSYDERSLRAVETYRQILDTRIRNYAVLQDRRLRQDTNALYLHSPVSEIKKLRLQTGQDRQIMIQTMKNRLNASISQTRSLTELLNALSPQSVLDRGYAIVEKNGHPVRSIAETENGEKISILLSDGRLNAEILDKETDNATE